MTEKLHSIVKLVGFNWIELDRTGLSGLESISKHGEIQSRPTGQVHEMLLHLKS